MDQEKSETQSRERDVQGEDRDQERSEKQCFTWRNILTKEKLKDKSPRRQVYHPVRNQYRQVYFFEVVIGNYITVKDTVFFFFFLSGSLELDNSYSNRPNSWERTKRVTLQVLSGCLPFGCGCNVKQVRCGREGDPRVQ